MNRLGRVKVERLLFIAECCPSLAVDALKLAVDEVKQSEMMDTQKYLTCVNSLNGLLESQSKPQLPVDSKWITRTQKQARDKSELLEHELKTYKNNLIKESIRVCLPSIYLYCLMLSEL
jgi:COP9 signalosome complex subunit 1